MPGFNGINGLNAATVDFTLQLPVQLFPATVHIKTKGYASGNQ